MIASAMVAGGLMGAAGVLLAALAAHVAPGTGLESAGYVLLFHAAAVLGGAALLGQGRGPRPMLVAAVAGWVLGSVLFSADLAVRAFAGHRLFALAAPTGGVVLIVAWLALAAAGMLRFLRS